MKLVSLSEIPVSFSKQDFHIIVPAVPDIKDAITPDLDIFFQNKTSNNAGPMDEPIPDHA